MPQRAPLPQDD
ncbi:hypothetical protein MUS_1058 [Bacillus velezensis YAU B9601-Y2]|uniref:Uncharacterized protein n=1 Tax=Bacillus amyloliquefaciens (strain Y2) TaxID=1155777 RepID=I2C365_BACAY|nr:hypothetical protein MUS_1058 [Bacillus velezensis YAU B9601-Y2]